MSDDKKAAIQDIKRRLDNDELYEEQEVATTLFGVKYKFYSNFKVTGELDERGLGERWIVLSTKEMIHLNELNA